jgi:hypothetical protein
MTPAKKAATKRRNPLLQRYQVEVRGSYYYVVDTTTKATVAGPFKAREPAQRQADNLEKLVVQPGR